MPKPPPTPGQPLMTIQATANEVIVLQAALHHYLEYIGYDRDLQSRAAPLIHHFIQRLHDQLPPRKEQVEAP